METHGSITRFDLRALAAIIVGTAAVMAVLRYDFVFSLVLAGPLLILWAVSATCRGDVQRRLRVLFFGLAGTLAGSLPVVPVTSLVLAETNLPPAFAVSASCAGALIGALLGRTNSAGRRLALRAILLLTLVVGLLLIGLAIRHRHEIWIVNAGNAYVYYEAHVGDESAYALNREASQSVKRLRQWLGITYAYHLDIDLDQHDNPMAHIPRLTRLQSLSLKSSHLTAADLTRLRSLKQLESLSLESSNLDSTGLAVLTELPNLYHFASSGSAIDDQGMRHIANCSTLRVLGIDSTTLTPSTLRQLRGMQLNTLVLRHVPLDGPLVDELIQLQRVTFLRLEYPGIAPGDRERLRSGFPGAAVRVTGPLPGVRVFGL